MSDRLGRVLLIIILLLALSLRAYHLDGQSLWADEGNSAALAGRSLAQIAHDSAHDIHPPLYYWLLHGWTGLLGTSEIALRSLSAALGLALVWLTYLVGRRLHGQATGLLAAFLAAVNPFQVYYSQEARMYTLLAVCGAGVMYGFIRLVQAEIRGIGKLVHWYTGDQRPNLPTYQSTNLPIYQSANLLIPLFAAAGLYTHYSFPILLLVVNTLYLAWWFASRRRARPWKRLARWAALQGAAALLFLPWLPVAVQRLTSWPGVAAPFGWGEALLATLRLLALGPGCATRVSGPWLIPFGVLLALGLWWGKSVSQQVGKSQISKSQISRSMALPRWLVWLIPVTWLVLPVLMMLTLGLFKEAYLKFLLVASPPFCLLLARGVANLQIANRKSQTVSRISRLASYILPLASCILLLIPTTHALHSYYLDPDCARDDYRSMAQYVAAVATPDDGVLLNAPGQIDVWDYYDRSGLAVYPLPRERPPDATATVAQLETIAAQHRTLYTLFWATDESDPNRIVETWLDQHGFKATDVWQGNVRFVTYAFPLSADEPALAVSPDLRFGEPLWLREVAVLNDLTVPGEIVQVRLIWEAELPIERRYKVTLQLLDEREQIIAQRDAEPAGESRPTDGWPVGERIHDAHGLPIPLATPPGTYHLIVGLYDRENGQRLLLADGSDHLTIGSITVQRPAVPPPAAVLPMRTRRSHDFGAITLLGHDHYKRDFGHAPDTPLHPGDLLHVTFFWQADEAPSDDWGFALALQGQPITLTAPLVSDAYPTSRWQTGEIVRGEHDLLLPSDLRTGRYRLALALTASDGTPTRTVTLGTIRVRSGCNEEAAPGRRQGVGSAGFADSKP